MISLQRSMYSSQMYTPGPAMSFLTCFWLFPQNEHFSRSPPSPMRATQLLLYMGPLGQVAACPSRHVPPGHRALRLSTLPPRAPENPRHNHQTASGYAREEAIPPVRTT